METMMREHTGMNGTQRRALFVNDRLVLQECLRPFVLGEHGLVSLFVTTILVIGILCLAAFLVIRSDFVPNRETADSRPPTLASYDSRH